MCLHPPQSLTPNHNLIITFNQVYYIPDHKPDKTKESRKNGLLQMPKESQIHRARHPRRQAQERNVLRLAGDDEWRREFEVEGDVGGNGCFKGLHFFLSFLYLCFWGLFCLE